jgi:hypothetical protein
MKADSDTRADHAYTFCGWQTRSDIPFTGVPTSARGGESVDVLIQLGPGDSPIAKNAGMLIQHSAEYSLLRIENVADFEISRGCQIRVWPAAGAAQNDIEIFLCGPAWATLCHQRGVLPLHASAIAAAAGIAAFAGYSRVGKSTTAALLNSFNYELVADDILPVSFNQNSVPGAWPFLRRLKLHGDPIAQLGLTPIELVSKTLDKEKYFVRPQFVARDTWSRLERLYLLEIDPIVSGVAIDRVTGSEAVQILINQTYHFQFILDSGQLRQHLEFCTQLAFKIPIYRLRRCPSVTAGHVKSVICAHLENTLT